jgi:uncharacterized protein
MLAQTDLQPKLESLETVVRELGSVLVAFSGGIDSSLVLKVAYRQLGDRAVAVTAVSPTFPAVELDLCRQVARNIGARHRIVETDQLTLPDFVMNDAARCYHCKTDLYTLLGKVREEEGAAHIANGTNQDDLGDDRPGLQAAREWNVRSPLLDAHLTKEDVRALARLLGLSNWDKPAAACLSSRITRGIMITRENLSRVEQAEQVLLREGFVHIRVRDHGDVARIEVAEGEIGRLVDEARRQRVSDQLRALGFRFVTVDLDGYRRGGVSLGPPRA